MICAGRPGWIGPSTCMIAQLFCAKVYIWYIYLWLKAIATGHLLFPPSLPCLGAAGSMRGGA